MSPSTTRRTSSAASRDSCQGSTARRRSAAAVSSNPSGSSSQRPSAPATSRCSSRYGEVSRSTAPVMPAPDSPKTFSTSRPRVSAVRTASRSTVIPAYAARNSRARRRSTVQSQSRIAAGAHSACSLAVTASAASAAAAQVARRELDPAAAATASSCSSSGRLSPRRPVTASRPVCVVSTTPTRPADSGSGQPRRRSTRNVTRPTASIAASASSLPETRYSPVSRLRPACSSTGSGMKRVPPTLSAATSGG